MTQISTFSDVLDAARAALAMAGFAVADEALITELLALVAADGPNPANAPGLERLRWRLAEGTEDECTKYLEIADHKARSDSEAIEGSLADKIAALKLLRHFYLANLRGGQQLWIASLPKAFRAWPQQELRSGAPTIGSLRSKANEGNERFSFEDRKNLGTAAQDALKWSMDAQIKLAPVAAGDDEDSAPGVALIRRWFCDEGSSEREVWRFAQILAAGFQKMASAANSGRLIFTDHPSYRGSSYEQTEAFVFAGRGRDRPDVIYIEGDFFHPDPNVLSGRQNWARIVVHELSHREANTVDVPNRYGWQGIKPTSAGYPAASAITNADNWAYFAADCADILIDDHRNQLLQ